ncbi:substrate-binding periplasmic protein [Rhodovibrionaceae bacterium A322]
MAFLLVFAGGQALAQESVKVMGKIIPQVLTDQSDSFFQAMLREIALRADFELEVEVLPGKRALSLFDQGQGDVFVPAQLEQIASGMFQHPVVSSEPVLDFQRFVYVKAGQKNLTSLAELSGKRIGLVRGYSYGPLIDKNETFAPVYGTDVSQLIKMLNRDRIDAFIAFPNSVYRLTKWSDETAPQRDAMAPITRNRITFAFRDTQKGRELRRKFNLAIEQMKADGSFKRLIAPFEPELDKSSFRPGCQSNCLANTQVCVDFRTCLEPDLWKSAHFPGG